MICFIGDDLFREAVPSAVVAYTSEELLELFGDCKNRLSPQSLRLIHEAKRLGCRVRSYENDGNKRETEDTDGK
jgi:hypothetical protein